MSSLQLFTCAQYSVYILSYEYTSGYVQGEAEHGARDTSTDRTAASASQCHSAACSPARNIHNTYSHTRAPAYTYGEEGNMTTSSPCLCCHRLIVDPNIRVIPSMIMMAHIPEPQIRGNRRIRRFPAKSRSILEGGRSDYRSTGFRSDFRRVWSGKSSEMGGFAAWSDLLITLHLALPCVY